MNIFISSTFEDLALHYQSLVRAIRENGMKVAEVPYSQNMVLANIESLRKADLFIGIYASRYGDILKDFELSLTEIVYEEALRLQIPRLIYLVDPHASWAVEHLHTNFQGAMMRIFLDRFPQENPEIRYFDTPQDLNQKALLDIAAIVARKNP
jgi:hypothetical protein